MNVNNLQMWAEAQYRVVELITPALRLGLGQE